MRSTAAATRLRLESGRFEREPRPRAVRHDRTRQPRRLMSARRQTPKSPQPADAGPDPRAALVAQLWARAVPADPTPGRLYLALRFAWPPHGIGPDLPATVRWLDVQAAPAKVPDARWVGLPDGAAGALAFAWKRSAGACPGCDEPRSTRHDRPANRTPMAPHVRDTGRDGIRGAGAVERGRTRRTLPKAKWMRSRSPWRRGVAPGGVYAARRYVGDAH